MEQVRDIPHHAMGDPWRYGYPDHSMSEPMSTSDEYGEVSNLCHVQNIYIYIYLPVHVYIQCMIYL